MSNEIIPRPRGLSDLTSAKFRSQGALSFPIFGLIDLSVHRRRSITLDG